MTVDDILNWDSKRIIGNVTPRFKQLERKGWDWSSFYNGWLEGRFAMLNELQTANNIKACDHLLWSEVFEGGGNYLCRLGHKTSCEKCEKDDRQCESFRKIPRRYH